jgi:hypothetical protein
MGILSRLRERKEKKKKVVDGRDIKLVEPDKKSKKKAKYSYKGTDVAGTLAMYIVNLEIIIAAMFDRNDEFVRVYEKFRRENDIEAIINKVADYQVLYEIGSGVVLPWLEKETEI